MISLFIPSKSSNPFVDPDAVEKFGGLQSVAKPKTRWKSEFKPLSYYGAGAPPPKPVAMSRDEEKAMFLRYYARRTAKTRDLLVRHYLCWAFDMAAKFKGPRLVFDEAISVANEGLMEALEGYNPKLGFRFTTYAAWTLRRKLIEALLSTYPVRVSDHVRKQWRELSETPETLAAQMAGGPDDEPRTFSEFFERLGESSDVDLTQLHARPEDSPFMPAEAEDPSAVLEASDLTDETKKAIRTLSSLEQKIIRARHYQEPPESYISIAHRLHISKSSARDTYDVALVKLRRYFTEEK